MQSNDEAGKTHLSGANPGKRAPEHVVSQLAAVLHVPHSSAGPPQGTAEWAELVRAQARRLADAWWAEAYLAGAGWAIGMFGSPRLRVRDRQAVVGDRVVSGSGVLKAEVRDGVLYVAGQPMARVAGTAPGAELLALLDEPPAGTVELRRHDRYPGRAG